MGNELDINVKDKNYRQTFLHWASECDNEELLNFLIDKNIDVNAVDQFRNTALHQACANCGANFVRILIDNGADVDARDRGLWTPLNEASIRGEKEIVNLLIENDARDFSDDCLHHSTGYPEIVQSLINVGANVHNKDECGRIALHLAREPESIKILIQNGSDINARDEHNWTPLHWATFFTNKEAIKSLIDNGADINAQDIHGETPLHYMTSKTEKFGWGNLHVLQKEKRRKEIVQILINYGADVNIGSLFGRNALDDAIESEYQEVVDLLIENGAKKIKNQNNHKKPDIMKDFNDLNIRKDEKMSVHNYDRSTLIDCIVSYSQNQRGNMGVKQALDFVNTRFDINLPFDKDGATFLHAAAVIGSPDSIKIFLDNGHYINPIDDIGLTPFDRSMIVGNIENSEYLLSRGAKVKFKNKNLWKNHMIPALYELGYDLRFNGLFSRLKMFSNKPNNKLNVINYDAVIKIKDIETIKNDLIDPNLRNQLQAVINSSNDIIKRIADDPRDLSLSRKFINIYLDGVYASTEKYIDIQSKIHDSDLYAKYCNLLNDMNAMFQKHNDKLLMND